MWLKGLWEESSVPTWKSIGLSSLHMSSELRRQGSSDTASPRQLRPLSRCLLPPVSLSTFSSTCCEESPALGPVTEQVPGHGVAGSESILIFERNENRRGDWRAAGLASAAFLGDVQSRWLCYLQSGEYLFERKKTNLCLVSNISVLLSENTFWIYLFSLKYAK